MRPRMTAVNWENGKAYFFQGEPVRAVRHQVGSPGLRLSAAHRRLAPALGGRPRRGRHLGQREGVRLPGRSVRALRREGRQRRRRVTPSPRPPGDSPGRVESMPPSTGETARPISSREASTCGSTSRPTASIRATPQPISQWHLPWSEDVDSAVNWGNGKAYFFKGSQYVRFDIASDRVDPGYPPPDFGVAPAVSDGSRSSSAPPRRATPPGCGTCFSASPTRAPPRVFEMKRRGRLPGPRLRPPPRHRERGPDLPPPPGCRSPGASARLRDPERWGAESSWCGS